MQRNDARLQMLTLAMFGILALLVFDFQPVEEAMADFGLSDGDEAIAAEEPAPKPWIAEGPSLAVGGETPKAAPKSCCPGEIAIDTPAEKLIQQWTEALTSPDRARPPATGIHITQMPKVPEITSMWPTDGEDRPTWASLDAAAKELDLTPEQRAAWERTIEDAKRDLDDLRHVPDAEGRTWHSITSGCEKTRGDLRKTLGTAHALADFLISELNGGETYADARRRILDSYKDRLRGDLTPEQQAAFDAHDVDGLMDSAVSIVATHLTLGLTPKVVEHHVRIHVTAAPF